MSSHGLIGREIETAAVEAAVAVALDRASLLLIEGPAGIGKTALADHAAAAAVAAHLDAGAAIAIERIYMPRSDRSWVEVTLSGRLGPDGSRGLLLAAAKAVPRLVG